MIKRERPNRVTFPNGRTFIVRQQRLTRGHLPANVGLARPHKEEAAPKVDGEDNDKQYNKGAELVVNF